MDVTRETWVTSHPSSSTSPTPPNPDPLNLTTELSDATIEVDPKPEPKPTVAELHTKLAHLAALADELNVTHGDVMNAVSTTSWVEEEERPTLRRQRMASDDSDPYPQFYDERPLSEMFESFARRLNRQQHPEEPPQPKPSFKSFTNKLLNVRRAVRTPSSIPTPEIPKDAEPSLKELTDKLIIIERAIRPALRRIQNARQTMKRRRDSTQTLDEYHNPIYWGNLTNPIGDLDLLEDYLKEEPEEEVIKEEEVKEPIPEEEKIDGLQNRVEQLEAILSHQLEEPQPFLVEKDPTPETPEEEEDDSDRIIVVPMGDHWVTKEVYYAEMERRKREAEEALKAGEKIAEDAKLPFGAKFVDLTPASKDLPVRSPTDADRERERKRKEEEDAVKDVLEERKRPKKGGSDLPTNNGESNRPARKDELSSYFNSKPPPPNTAIENTEGGNNFAKWFKIFNLARAVATGVYGIWEASRQLGDDAYVAVGARPLLGVTIFFLIVEILVAFVKAFPKSMWIFWNVRDWDPYAKYWTVWAIVADHELISDVLPVLVNVVLRIFSYRLVEILAEPNAGNTLTQSTFQFSLDNLTSSKYHNLVLLLLFCVTLTYTILFHAVRLFRLLAFKKDATLLGAVVLVKGVFLLLDLFTNGAMLYEVLVWRGKDFLRLNNWVFGIMVSVVSLGPVVTLIVNALVNLPLHYAFLQLQLQNLKTSTKVSRARLLPTTLRKTFHPFLLPVFLYALYCIIGIILVLGQLRSFDPFEQIAQGHMPKEMVPGTGFFGWGSGGGGGVDVMFGLVWLDLVVNYGIGVAIVGVYWVWRLISVVWTEVFGCCGAARKA
ncbi:hypothetical protein HK097_009905 [Rhizophlyctis rosea]|uniref:Uncharacterized protein n=1 Tax=Rhizophlyctis rosea TaxID=64517 RepID=A0AAD5S874_9FUNG|nr:hypothetical protein HK097_009905 [Rhizophlyctis rosea]